MASAAFDTLTVSKDLQDAGIEARHAEAIAMAVKQAQGDLATKQDIALLKTDIDQLRTELKSDIDQLRTELKSDIDQLRTELKSDIDKLKSDIDQLRTELKSDIDKLKSDIDQLRTELKSDIDKLKSDITWIKWSMAIMIAIMLGGFSLLAS